MNLIAQISEYIVARNNLKKARQRVRAKANYYKKLFNFHGSSMSNEDAKNRGIRGYPHWNKPGKKQVLRILYKKYEAEQLLVEIKLHQLAMDYRKILNKIRKDMPFRMFHNTDYICGLDTGLSYFNLKKIEQIHLDEQVEKILLRNEEVAI